MFSKEYVGEINAAFEQQLSLLEYRKEEILTVLQSCTEDEAEAVKFLYTAMPLCDGLDYPASLYLSYAKHGVFLWYEGAFAGRVPEKIFANYVLHHRVNNEDICDHRDFFYQKLKDCIAGKTMYESVIEANYWCAQEGTYHTTDDRTENPLTMYRSALGRCGEESTFAVSVFRSLGIPARQVYVPLWSHCDDNHAWVEAWCDGSWYFLGACEPEEKLNRGWFTEASARAMLVHSRWFGKEQPEDEVVGTAGMSRILNHLDLYAEVASLSIHVSDEAGNPVKNAKVSFQVLNYAYFGNVATVFTDESGDAMLKTGYGSLWVCASSGEQYGESLALVQQGKENRFEIVVRGQMQDLNAPIDIDFIAPSPTMKYSKGLTKSQKEAGDLRLKEANEKRKRKVAAFYSEKLMKPFVASFPEEEQEFICESLHKSRGNINELIQFLQWDCEGICKESWKYAILKSLEEKDFWDVKAELLIEHCTYTEENNDLPETIFNSYVLCPRVSYENLTPFRKWVQEYFTKEQKAQIRSNPRWLYEYVEKRVQVRPELEYSRLITSVQGCLRGGVGSEHSKKVVCVQIYRALGVPARLNPMDYALEYYQDGAFQTIGRSQQNRSAKLWLRGPVGPDVKYLQHLSVSRFDEQQFRILWLDEENVERVGHEIGISLVPGIYRLVSSNRLTNGNQFSQKFDFTIGDNEEKHITLFVRGANLEDMLEKNHIDDIPLRTLEGEEKMLSVLRGNERALFIWLEEGREPTEHILNEIYDERNRFSEITAPMYFVVSNVEALKNPTLHRTLEALPNITVLLEDFDSNYNNLARQMFLEPGRLPLVLVTGETGEGIYGIAGYNVGTAAMVARILS